MSRWEYYNPNPLEKRVGDCSIRACAAATDKTWNEVFRAISEIAYRQKDVLSANSVWGEYLNKKGYVRNDITPEMDIRTVDEFAEIYKSGVYVLGLEGHVVTVKEGRYFDTWDSGEKRPLYYWTK